MTCRTCKFFKPSHCMISDPAGRCNNPNNHMIYLTHGAVKYHLHPLSGLLLPYRPFERAEISHPMEIKKDSHTCSYYSAILSENPPN